MICTPEVPWVFVEGLQIFAVVAAYLVWWALVDVVGVARMLWDVPQTNRQRLVALLVAIVAIIIALAVFAGLLNSFAARLCD